MRVTEEKRKADGERERENKKIKRNGLRERERNTLRMRSAVRYNDARPNNVISVRYARRRRRVNLFSAIVQTHTHAHRAP